jgi:hypothetical protein
MLGASCLAALFPAAPAQAVEGLWFEEVSARWGLAFRHHHGGSGRRYMVETVVGGVALFDYDGDGDVDVLFVDGGPLPGYAGEAPRSRLYRNEGGGRFADVTDASGIVVAGYGAGATAGDVDGDGDLDLYVTAFGRDQLLRNQGDGTFADVTAAAGLGEAAWGASAAFADLDRDADLDLYVANYVDYAVERHQPCHILGYEVYCNPQAYPGAPDVYYRNRGDGTFEDATAASGLAEATPGPGLGVVASDLDDDGWPDLYVANDSTANYLYLNRHGRFEEVALLAGVAYGDLGRPEAGMGVACGDVDGDGRFDLVVTNFELETNALYRNLGGGLFADARFAANIAESSFLVLAFGVDLADFDQDGDLDLAIANGHIHDNAAEIPPGGRYAQPNQLLENLGGRFQEVASSGLDVVRVSRGLATGDLDGDGDLDLAIVDSNDLAEVYANRAADGGGGFLLVDLASPGGNRFGVGARLTLEAAGRTAHREVRTAGSYLSQNALTAHFGLGAAERARLDVAWPDGRRQRLLDVPADRRLQVVTVW